VNICHRELQFANVAAIAITEQSATILRHTVSTKRRTNLTYTRTSTD